MYSTVKVNFNNVAMLCNYFDPPQFRHKQYSKRLKLQKKQAKIQKSKSGRPIKVVVVSTRSSATGAPQHGQRSFAKRVGNALVFNFQKKKLFYAHHI